MSAARPLCGNSRNAIRRSGARTSAGVRPARVNCGWRASVSGYAWVSLSAPAAAQKGADPSSEPRARRNERPMGVAALISWLVTAFVGLYLLAVWLIENDVTSRGAAASRLPAPVIAGHIPPPPRGQGPGAAP